MYYYIYIYIYIYIYRERDICIDEMISKKKDKYF